MAGRHSQHEQPSADISERVLASATVACVVLLAALLALAIIGIWLHPPV